MKESELKIQSDCVRYLRSLGIFCHSVPNEAGGRSVIMQSKLTAAGLVSGVADLVVWWDSGIGYVEFKTPQGTQSLNQKTFQKKCIEHGIEYAIIRSLDDMKNLTEAHLYGWT